MRSLEEWFSSLEKQFEEMKFNFDILRGYGAIPTIPKKKEEVEEEKEEED